MTVLRRRRWLAVGALFALSTPVCIQPASASWASSGWTQHIVTGVGTSPTPTTGAFYFRDGRSFASSFGTQRYGQTRYGQRNGALQCVPFARANSGIELVGNAATWWNKAAGVYQRGSRPEVGSVLNFRAVSRMRLGHVAVVSRVIDSRNLEIDHANWASPGGVSRSISVVDVSPQNDWTAVRVALNQGNEYGAVYPTYGFIYDRPEQGTQTAATGEGAGSSPGHEADVEVAEAADDAPPSTRHAAYSRAKAAKSLRGAAVQRVTSRSQPGAESVHRHRGHPNT